MGESKGMSRKKKLQPKRVNGIKKKQIVLEDEFIIIIIIRHGLDPKRCKKMSVVIMPKSLTAVSEKCCLEKKEKKGNGMVAFQGH